MSKTVVKASDILGRELGARAANDAAAAAAAALDFDLGLLMVSDPHKTAEECAELVGLDDSNSEEKKARAQRRIVRQATRALVSRLWELPVKTHDDEKARLGGLGDEETEVGMAVAKLPAPIMKLPREKPQPETAEEKPKTRWEKFAERKGIVKQKRSRLVWDEVEKDWVPRFGKGSKAKLARAREEWVVECKDQDTVVQIGSKKNKKIRAKLGTDLAAVRGVAKRKGAVVEAPTVDPFDARDSARAKERKKQVVNQVRNQRRARKERTGHLGVLDADVKAGALRSGQKTGKRRARVDTALKAARVSTASLGKFDKEVHVEGTKMPQLKRRKVVLDKDNEKETSRKLLKKIVGDI